MALIVHFKKMRETDQEVEYAFGYPDLDRRLVINKQTREGRPLVGREGTRYGGVIVKVLRTQQETGAWPEKGVLAS